MPEIQASRRLVKSPPELWAEVSDAASLARHLGEVGEITITRLEPETTVAWEGEHASGTVALAPAGWGTSVTLTAEPIAVEPDQRETVAPEPETVTPADGAQQTPIGRVAWRRTIPRPRSRNRLAPRQDPPAAAPSPQPKSRQRKSPRRIHWKRCSSGRSTRSAKRTTAPSRAASADRRPFTHRR
jgi:hypothetical protein